MLTKDLRLTQELLGHSSPTTTSRYAAFDASQTVDMVAAMDAAWAEGARVGKVSTPSKSDPFDAEVADSLWR